MKILLDKCVPIQVRNALRNHEVHSTDAPEWSGLTNGELLIRTELEGLDSPVIIAILELWTNHRPTLEQRSDRIRSAVGQIVPGEFTRSGGRTISPRGTYPSCGRDE